MRRVARRRRWIGFLVAALALAWASPALAIPMEFIANGEFGTDATPSLSSWTVSPSGVDAPNARASTDSINISGGNAGFSTGTAGFFTSAFALLGDQSGDIAGPPIAGTHSISQAFTLLSLQGSTPVLSWSLALAVSTVFDGRDNAPTDKQDTFEATLTGVSGTLTLFSQTSNGFPECGPATDCTSTQLGQQPFTITYPSLLPGDYTLTFTLVENAQGGSSGSSLKTNTAVGVDAVSALGTPTLAAVSEPTTLLLWGLTAVGLGLILRKTVRRA